MTIASETPESQRLPVPPGGPLPISVRLRHPRHLLAEWRNCRHTPEGLRHADALKRLCLRLCEELQLKVAGNAFFQFEPSGVAGTILFDGSHIALHTWPDSNKLTADIHLQHSGDTSAALVLMERLKTCFQPASSSIDPFRRQTRLN